jgi:hypothetical protein
MMECSSSVVVVVVGAAVRTSPVCHSRHFRGQSF